MTEQQQQQSTDSSYEPNWTHKSKYLQGNFGPIAKESDRVRVAVRGQVPAALLGGIYARNGPNPHFAPVDQHHWFDGDGRVHSVHFDRGASEATFSSKWVRTAGFQFEEKLGRSWYYGLADLSNVLKLFVEGVRSTFFGNSALGKVAANTNIIYHDRRLLALVENGVPHHIAVQTLETYGEYDYDGQLKHPFTAHPKVDPVTGEMLSFGYRFNEAPAVQYFLVGADGKKAPSVPITLLDQRSVMMHDFAFSRSYAIFLDLPYIFSLKQLMRLRPPLDFVPEAGARIGVLPRKDNNESRIKWFDIKSCFAFHVANSWEEGNKVIVIVNRYERFGLERLSNDAGKPDELRGALYQWTLDMETGAVEEQALVSKAGDFPVCDEQNRWGYKTRYLWYGGSGKTKENMPAFTKIIKVDLKDNSVLEHLLPPGQFNDEFVFVNANPAHLQYRGDYDEARNASAPDDNGWLVGFVYEQASNTSHLLVLNAATMKEEARVELPHRIPHGFHGKWLTKEQIANARDGSK